ncbi:hypothetical protein D9M69_623860 [compost metagenome]
MFLPSTAPRPNFESAPYVGMVSSEATAVPARSSITLKANSADASQVRVSWIDLSANVVWANWFSEPADMTP